MPKASDPWTTVSLHPLIGPLDTRSRPADIPQGAWRWKLNMQCTPEGKLCRRGGFQKLFGDLSSFTNHDFHHQGQTREPILGTYESTANDGTRLLFVLTKSRIAVLDVDAGLWTDVLTGMGAEDGGWECAQLQDVIAFTDDYDPVQFYNVETGALVTSDLQSSVHLTAARIVIEFNGLLVLMNTVEPFDTGVTPVRCASRVRWGDMNQPLVWAEDQTQYLSGHQDICPGETILAAAHMLSSIYIYTDQSIWKMSLSGNMDPGADIFSFTQVYTEPEAQSGCIHYPYSLVSTGEDHWYMAKDGIYRFNPYIAAPIREDWMHRASGAIYKKPDTAIDAAYCESAIATYRPDAREIWISWPSKAGDTKGINDWTLVAQLEQKTADIVDTGFTAFGSFRRNAIDADLCSEVQDFIAASSVDWCLKSIGGAFSREYAILADPSHVTVDLEEVAAYTDLGYNSQLRAMIPLGYFDRDKLVRNVLVDHDTSEQMPPICVFQLRIGNSYALVDPNDEDDVCAPQWRKMPDLPVSCPTPTKISDLTKGKIPSQGIDTKARLRPAVGTEWRMYEQGRFLYFELTISNPKNVNGVYPLAIGGDTCLERIDFDAMAMAKA